ncbi:MAG: glycosyltransferase family 4 protein [Candidatus Levybacteria bacterium]|nr:glycosyltransferase family 4 protein [Candidatus Levybacteria bacterium]
MKIGILGTIWLNIPPEGYGGTEEVLYNLTNGLSDRGHQVSLFGPATAKVRGTVIPTVDKPLRDQNIEWTNISYILQHITAAFDRAGEFDLLHVHLNKSQDYLALPLAVNSAVPVVFTLHFKVPTPAYKPDRYMLLHKYRAFPFTSISDSQREADLNFIATVYNCLDLSRFPFSDKTDDYFVWLGKVNPVKGTKEAIKAAKMANVKLYVLGAVDEAEPALKAYYEQEVKPLIDGERIIWKGELGSEEKARLLGGAKGFLNPILWDEPFGLVMAESQAVGTPVISFRRGAALELIIDGKTGYLVDTVDQMVEKIKIIDKIDRRACRKNIEENFIIEKMIDGYEKAYEIAIKNWSTYLEKQKSLLKQNIS